MGIVSFMSMRRTSRCIKRDTLMAWKERYRTKKLRNTHTAEQPQKDCPRDAAPNSEQMVFQSYAPEHA